MGGAPWKESHVGKSVEGVSMVGMPGWEEFPGRIPRMEKTSELVSMGGMPG